MSTNAKRVSKTGSTLSQSNSPADAFVRALSEKFSVPTPVCLTPPDPAAFGYRDLNVSLSCEEGCPDGLKIPQSLFIQIYELLLRNIGGIPTGTTLNISFTPCLPEQE